MYLLKKYNKKNLSQSGLIQHHFCDDVIKNKNYNKINMNTEDKLHCLKNGAGFTFMELIVTITMSVLVIAGLGSIFAGTIKLWSRIHDTGEVLREGKLAIEWMTRDIKEGKLTAITNNSMNLNNIVQYSLNNSILRRNSDIIARNVTNLNFTGYNKNATVETDPSKINFVLIFVTVAKSDKILNFSNGANLRNFLET